MTRIGLMAAALVLVAQGALAGGFAVSDAYLRSSMPSAKTAAAFLEITNNTGQDDVLIGVRSELAGKVQLHSHSAGADGVMRMGEIEGGVPIAAGESHVFARGGDHLMFMGLDAPLEQGREVAVTLVFEIAGEVEILVPVDRDR